MGISYEERLIRGGVVVYDFTVQVNGKRKKRTFDSKKQGYRWGDVTEEEMLAGRHEVVRLNRTFKELLEEYMRKVSPKNRGTVWETRRIEAWLKQGIGSWKLLDLEDCVGNPERVSPIVKWKNERLATVTSGTVRRELNLMKAIFSKALSQDWKWMKVHPMSGIEMPPDSPERKELWDKESIDSAIKALGYTYGSVPCNKKAEVALIFLIALETAQRSGEIVKTQRTNVSLDEGFVYLPEEIVKTFKARFVPLIDEGIKLYELALAMPKNSDGRLFSVSPYERDYIFREALKAAGIKNKRFHDARRTAATRMSDILGPFELAKVGGWTDLNTINKSYYGKQLEDIKTKLRNAAKD